MISTACKNNFTRFSKERVALQGYYRKLKTMKKKYFVLYEESDARCARLEYFDSEKKFKTNSTPKRIIKLKQCFNINRRLDTKHEHVIALSIKDGSFDIVMDSEENLNKWLKTLLKLQYGEDTTLECVQPPFEHVWQARIQRKGLAENKNIIGCYHVCLTTQSLTLIRIGSEQTSAGEVRASNVELFLYAVRRCGDSQCLFYMELGRQSNIGAGELWMETGDSLIAQSMHRMILNAMSSKKNDEPIGPMRKRSSSANEASKPMFSLQRRQTHSGLKNVTSSPLSGRDRCDSLPSSRHPANTSISSQKNISTTSNRPQFICSRYSHSPPQNMINPFNPSSVCSESEGSSLSMDELDEGEITTPFRYNSLSTGEMIPEEITDETCFSDCNKQSNILSEISSNKGNLCNLYHYQSKDSPSTFNYASSSDLQGQFNSCEITQCVAASPTMEISLKNGFSAKTRGHTRTSSFIEEILDGYVPMAPILNSESNINQATITAKSLEDTSCHLNAPTPASSITSGTPSIEICFQDYSSRKDDCSIALDNETEHSHDRPMRTYSVGSRLEHEKRRLCETMFNNPEEIDSRVRAFSVGSRKVSQKDIQNSMFLSASNQFNNNRVNEKNTTFMSSLSKNTNNIPNRGKKFFSAPILVHKNQNNNDRMSDLMEIDFSKNYSCRRDSFPSPPIKVLSYPINKPCCNQEESSKRREIVDTNNKLCNGSNPSPMIDHNYLEMKPITSSIETKHEKSKFQKISLKQRPMSSTLSPKSQNLCIHGDHCKSFDCMSAAFAAETKDDIDFKHSLFENSLKCVEFSNMADVKQRNQKNKQELLDVLSIKQSLSSEEYSKTSILSDEIGGENSNAGEHDECSKENGLILPISTLNLDTEKMTVISNNYHQENEKICKSDLNDIYSNISINNRHITDIEKSIDFLKIQTKGSSFKQKTNDHKGCDENNSYDNHEDTDNKSFLFTSESSKLFKPISSVYEETYMNKNFFKNNRHKTITEKCKVPHRRHQNMDFDILHLHNNGFLPQPKRNSVRPNSVNSDNTSPSKCVISRPSSVNSDYLQTISGSSSSSTLCGSSSSSSILCGSKNQSSPSTPRPHSSGNQLSDSETCIDREAIDEQSNVLPRPTSTGSDRDLCYASLVLPPSSVPIHSYVDANSDDSTPNSNTAPTIFKPQSSFNYAKIDFNLHDNKKHATSVHK